jgi:hypothetical protein
MLTIRSTMGRTVFSAIPRLPRGNISARLEPFATRKALNSTSAIKLHRQARYERFKDRAEYTMGVCFVGGFGVWMFYLCFFADKQPPDEEMQMIFLSRS